MKKIFLLLVASTLLVSCKQDSPTNNETTDTNKDTLATNAVTKEDYPYNQKFSDLATFLAGIEGSDSSSLKSLEENSDWKNYRDGIQAIWKKTEKKLPVMKEWVSNEMEDINSEGGTLFYPFSGPDFLHADVFFPEYDNVVMIGLEPIGTYPDIKDKMEDTTGLYYLNGVHKSLHAILALSFFRTVAMAKDFNGEVDGTLPVLFHFLVRTNHEVLYQEKVGVLPNGDLTNELDEVSDSTYFGNKYYYRRHGEDKIKTLTYFAVNLQNSPYVSRGGLVAKGLETRTDFTNYLKQIDIRSTYLKSASYLMHRPSFSIVRDIILNESEFVLQDDSGIPVQFFDTSKWELTFYGSYHKPISLFSERLQEDLQEIYSAKSANIKPLPFGIGYQFHKGTSNLMIGRKY